MGRKKTEVLNLTVITTLYAFSGSLEMGKSWGSHEASLFPVLWVAVVARIVAKFEKLPVPAFCSTIPANALAL